MLKLLCGAAALACMITPALAYDADPASFRANPQAWVRNTLMPACKTPADATAAAQCACMVPLLAEHTTEADVASVNTVDEKKGFLANPITKIAMGATLLCWSKK